MTSKTKSESSASPLRTPKAKNKLGLKIPKIAMPHDDLIVPEKPKFEIVQPQNEPQTSLPSVTRQTSLSSMTRQTSQNDGEIAPSKNYQKVPNSITKQAIPDGLFKGKDKHLYDVLYSLTRGDIEPKRKIRISKTKLMKLSGIGARITFDACIERLIEVELLNLKIFAGEHEGNEFEIFLPEEIDTLTSQSSMTSQTSLTSPAQKLDRLVCLETSQTSQSLNSVDTTIYSEPKTSLKTNTIDDESAAAFSVFFEKISEACERVTGKPVSRREREKWGTLADLLILELESAARRAEAISSAPAFLTEVLRRKLLSGAAILSNKLPRAKIDAVNKPNASGDYEKKPLDEKGREAALIELRDFAGDSFLEDFKKWYLEEDWQWLMKQLSVAEKTDAETQGSSNEK